MPWPSQDWQAGNWYSQEGSGSAGQDINSATLSGVVEFLCVSIVGQGNQTSSMSAIPDYEVVGSTSQAAGSSDVLVVPELLLSGSGQQANQTALLAAGLEIESAATTDQGSQWANITKPMYWEGSWDDRLWSSSLAGAEIEIEGVSVTAQSGLTAQAVATPEYVLSGSAGQASGTSGATASQEFIAGLISGQGRQSIVSVVENVLELRIETEQGQQAAFAGSTTEYLITGQSEQDCGTSDAVAVLEVLGALTARQGRLTNLVIADIEIESIVFTEQGSQFADITRPIYWDGSWDGRLWSTTTAGAEIEIECSIETEQASLTSEATGTPEYNISGSAGQAVGTSDIVVVPELVAALVAGQGSQTSTSALDQSLDLSLLTGQEQQATDAVGSSEYEISGSINQSCGTSDILAVPELQIVVATAQGDQTSLGDTDATIESLVTSGQEQQSSIILGNIEFISIVALSNQNQSMAIQASIEISSDAVTDQSQTSDGVLTMGEEAVASGLTGQGANETYATAQVESSASVTSRQSQSASGMAEIIFEASAGTSQSQSSRGRALNIRVPRLSLRKLLKYPHRAVFETGADEAVALVLDRDYPAVWSVTDGVLSIECLGNTAKYDLSVGTLGGLISLMQYDGFAVAPASGADLSRLAISVAPTLGQKTQADPICAHTNPMWDLFSSYAAELDEANFALGQALRQMVIHQSESEWTDYWGELFNLVRGQGQSDGDYAKKIPVEAFRIRVNARAIEQAVFDATGYRIIIEEPWGSMFRLDESALSGTQKFYNGETVGYHIIRPVTVEPIDWSKVLPVIERNKAGGIIVLPPETRQSVSLNADLDGIVSLGITTQYGDLVRSAPEGRLSFMVLSRDEYTRNYPAIISSVSTHLNSRPITWADGGWDDRMWRSYIFEDECPVSASMQTWQADTSNELVINIGGDTEMVVTSYGVDRLEV